MTHSGGWCLLGNQVSQGVSHQGVFGAFGNQGFQRVCQLGRVQVKHQPVLVGGHGGQGENLGCDCLFEVQHQSHHAGRVLRRPNTGNGGVVRADLGDKFLQGRIQLDAFDVHRQPRRIRDEKLAHLERAVRLDGDP